MERRKRNPVFESKERATHTDSAKAKAGIDVHPDKKIDGILSRSPGLTRPAVDLRYGGIDSKSRWMEAPTVIPASMPVAIGTFVDYLSNAFTSEYKAINSFTEHTRNPLNGMHFGVNAIRK